jgi:hypothetical protein
MTPHPSDTDQHRVSVHEEPDDLFDGLEVEPASDERVEYLEPLSGQERRLLEAFRLLPPDQKHTYLRLIVRRADGDPLDNLAL